jgi:chromosome segregation ATPase
MWQVIQYMDENPQASVKEVLGHFATTLEIDSQASYLLQEVDEVLVLRDQLRPLYGQKAHIETSIALLDSEFEMDVMIKYPPRQGTDKDRKAYKKELQSKHSDYLELAQKLEGYKEEIQTFENQMSDIQQRAKNARRVVESFNHYISFVMALYNQSIPNLGTSNWNVNVPVNGSRNVTVF